MADLDFVSDLNDGTAEPDTTVSVNLHDVQVGGEQQQPHTPPVQARKVDTQERAPKATSLRDQISSALKTEGEETPGSATQDGRPRNADGTFAPKPEEVPLPPVDPNAVVAPPLAAPQAVPVPNGIDAAVFNALPAETQASLARTMEAVNQQAAYLHHQTQSMAQVEQLLAPRRQAWALNGMTEGAAVSQLFALSDFASRDPSGFIKYFAQQSGVDLEQLPYDSDPVDPTVAALQQQVQQLQGFVQNQQYSQQQAVHDNTVNEVIDFFSQQDAGGNALRPYAAELGEQILPFITVVAQQNPSFNRQQVLQEAYNSACWGNAGVRAKMQQSEAAAAEAERIRTQQEKSRRAQQAGASMPSGNPGGTAPSPKDGSMSLRDTLKNAIASS